MKSTFEGLSHLDLKKLLTQKMCMKPSCVQQEH